MCEYTQKVDHRLGYLLAIVRQHLPDFKTPAMEYYDNKLASGSANYRTWTIRLNMVHLQENLESMLHETVAHEMAHLAAFAMHGRVKPHGAEWQRIMRSWFGVEPERTHDYDCSNVKARRQTRWEADCGCPDSHKVSTAKRNKILFKNRSYRCLTCSQLIRLTGEMV